MFNKKQALEASLIELAAANSATGNNIGSEIEIKGKKVNISDFFAPSQVPGGLLKFPSDM